ncbi:MAG: IS110 family transposase [Bacteroidia bacterium]
MYQRIDRSRAGKIIATRSFQNTKAGFEAAQAWLASKCKDTDIPCRLLLEVTGVYHENLLHFFHGQGYYVSLELAKRVKSYLKSLGHDSKTDKEDAKGLASMALHRKLTQWQPVSEQLHEIRQLVRFRNTLVESRVAWENQLHAYKHAHYSIKEIVRSLKRKIAQTHKEIRTVEAQIRALIRADSQLCKRFEQILHSLPGVGWISLATVIAETDGFSAIQSAKQLTKYAGYDVIERQSGTLSGKTRISKQGNARLRTAMYMPALAHLRKKKALYLPSTSDSSCAMADLRKKPSSPYNANSFV